MRMRALGGARPALRVMKPSSRIRASTTWLRSTAPSRFDHGESADGARASPAMSAALGQRQLLRRLAEQVRDIVSTP